MAKEELLIQINASAKGFNQEIDRLKKKTKELESGLANIAKISGAAFIALGSAIGLAANEFSKFESKFTNVVTLLDKGSFATKDFKKGVDDLKKGVLSLGAESGESFDTLNKGLFDIVSAGVDAEAAIDTLRIATELAAAGATDTAVAVDGITSALNAYELGAEEAGTIAAKFFAAQKAGKTTVEELSKNFGKAGATAKAYGISLDELLGSVSAVTLGGVKTEAAFTGLNALMANIAKPTAEAAAEAKKLGIEFNTTSLRSQGLEGFLNQLTSAQGFTQQSVEKLFGSVEAQKVAFALTGAQAGAFAAQLEILGDKTQLAVTFQEALAVKQATLEKATGRMTQAFKGAVVQIGEAFAPMIIELADTITGLAKKFNSLTKEEIAAIAGLLKAGAVIAGVVTGVATLAIGIFKAVRIIKALKVAFVAAKIGALGLGTVLTGGLLPILVTVASFLPEIIDGFKALFSFATKDNEPKSLKNINDELDKLKSKQEKIGKLDEIQKRNVGASPERIAALNEEIKKLEELRKAKFDALNAKETGSLLIRPETTGDPIADINNKLNGGASPVSIPLAAQGTDDVITQGGAAQVEEVKKTEEAKTQAVSEATQKRINALKNEQDLIKAQGDNVSKEQIDFMKRKQALDLEAIELSKQAAGEEKDLALENNRLKNESLIQDQEEYEDRRQETIAAAREEDSELQAELRELALEEREALNEEDLENLRGKIVTEQELERELANEKANEQVNRRNQYLRDEAKHGTVVAKVNQALGSDSVKNAASVAGELVALQQSKSKTLATIGKAAAVTQIGINTAESAAVVFAKLNALVPIAAPAIGAAGAASIIAFGAEQTANALSARRGGTVPSSGAVAGLGGRADKIPALLEAGETVVPKALSTDFIQGNGRPDTGGEDDGDFGEGDTGGGGQNISIEVVNPIDNEVFTDDLASNLIDRANNDNLQLPQDAA